MRRSLLAILLLISVLCGSATSCDKSGDKVHHTDSDNITNDKMADNKINIKVGSEVFVATLSDNNTAKIFKEMLPLTINMTELNGNEKYTELPKNLPTNSSNPGTIKNGDLMLYGSSTLVLFYKTFSTSYSYTKLGTVNDAKSLASALGADNVTVTFELAK
ncbi:cyclophilin-like fold protein [Sphingobacterium detergens]|uniref:Cyclophilin-like protein n=1 Tax=Sphingobacterium detergens TaxID=1145106 RepID=A0A420BKK4_SPHD1|nr:cyclophilin-like fold protein [Sphingobacterium detergens]RKE57230.1 cyclophilin-like protein [Sphingobacterium detergens]